jgi:hypothetical protein
VTFPSSSGITQLQATKHAQTTAETYQRYWRSLPQYDVEPTPVCVDVVPIGQRYRPNPFLSITVPGNGDGRQGATHGGLTVQLHQKFNDLDGFWLDVLPDPWVEKGAGEVETGRAGQKYTRPGAIFRKRYPV